MTAADFGGRPRVTAIMHAPATDATPSVVAEASVDAKASVDAQASTDSPVAVHDTYLDRLAQRTADLTLAAPHAAASSATSRTSRARSAGSRSTSHAAT